MNLFTLPKVFDFLKVLHLLTTDSRAPGVGSRPHYLVLQCALERGSSSIPGVPLYSCPYATKVVRAHADLITA